MLDTNYNPGIANGAFYEIAKIDPSGATNNQTIVFSASTGKWVAGSSVNSSLPSAEIFVGNVSNVATAVAVSGDISLDNAGAATVVGIQSIPVVLTGPATGDILYYDGTDWVNLPIGTTGQVLTVAGGVPTWA